MEMGYIKKTAIASELYNDLLRPPLVNRCDILKAYTASANSRESSSGLNPEKRWFYPDWTSRAEVSSSCSLYLFSFMRFRFGQFISGHPVENF